jgi:hypothetical protein
MLEIERLYENAMRDIDLQAKLKSDEITDKLNVIQEQAVEVD